MFGGPLRDVSTRGSIGSHACMTYTMFLCTATVPAWNADSMSDRAFRSSSTGTPVAAKSPSRVVSVGHRLTSLGTVAASDNRSATGDLFPAVVEAPHSLLDEMDAMHAAVHPAWSVSASGVLEVGAENSGKGYRSADGSVGPPLTAPPVAVHEVQPTKSTIRAGHRCAAVCRAGGCRSRFITHRGCIAS